MHGISTPEIPGLPGTYTGINTWGRQTVEVVDWEGETGEFVFQGNGVKWNIVSGTIGGMKLSWRRNSRTSNRNAIMEI